MKTIRFLIAAVTTAIALAFTTSTHARPLSSTEQAALAAEFRVSANYCANMSAYYAQTYVEEYQYSAQSFAFNDAANGVYYSNESTTLAAIYAAARDYCLAQYAAATDPLVRASWYGSALAYNSAHFTAAAK